MADTSQNDLEILAKLNADYLASDQNGDVRRYERILADDFMASLPDFLLRDSSAAPRTSSPNACESRAHRGYLGGV